MTRWLDEEEQQTWRAFLWTSRLLNEALDRQLQRDSGMPHTYYVILAMLSETPERRLTMSELARIVRSSPSRLSHAVTKLERLGHVRRVPHPTDRRTTLAVLTDKGFTVLREAAPGHVAAVRRHLFDRLTREQVLQLREILRAVLPALDTAGEAADIFGPS
ncbi:MULTISPECIES: MarR family winged helix-turn-helix transcriptional regulator [Thermomonospora]|uniref:Transcriptional regulator, MarR family n=1 Tax=Thermomonospora curvata (strain ATCC 19995 / DSM 43183 / JCM 3096 / KCTC 9072 / NBRC 15933 / NCIMB 10081 / Henssen B9) TaxID=471852 RepID=D1A4P4_THECD|nr:MULTISPECIES: MarR family transcriptional regulator [Thermomonospora]ACY96279.1 transcriptional regulator, MarR family [Thermomonospora curvata DSM 43183]PKK15697.1 MAG: MarR family transcriptional regulator [Thermomonospora sp. CIF 1]